MLHIKHKPTDLEDNIDTVGLSGIQKILEEDFVPKDQHANMQTYNDFAKLFRKPKERPKSFFRRLDESLKYHQALDGEFQYSKSWIAAFVMQRCGLPKHETDKIGETVDWEDDLVQIREAILFLFEKAHEADCARIEGSHAVKSGPANVVHFVARNPDGGISCTDPRLE